MNTPAAGWYPDPAGRSEVVRWWDGSTWTHHLASDAGASAPSTDGGPGAETGQAAGSVSTMTATDPPEAGDEESVEDRHPDRPGGYPPGYEPRRPTAQRRKTPIARSLIGLAVLIVAAALVLAIVSHRRAEDDLLSPPPPVPSGEQSSGVNGVSYDDGTRILTVPGLKLTMPDSPYFSIDMDPAMPGIVDEGAMATATVHKSYRGSSDWTAFVAAGKVDGDMAGDDLNATADAVFTEANKDMFSDWKTAVKKKQETTLTTGLPRPARVINADVHYHIKGLPSSYDRVSVMVVDLGDGSYSGWISSRPNDSGAKINKALQDSIKTVQVTS